ncbi:DUF6900 domain-containing protein [Adlercreutzia caecimuris]|jgi:hypothetical protein|uniref:DUF6900 domain-containing protein n=1 Tax=Adlercreutzia caecimuris B7 TaxID=1235794 RepID=R9L5X0_9ACTN|nr:hypothetical protein [Adlercreutzia caecimuris]EOS51152.1 hypothetical protein C811_01570 [Adlercreutzia caecimuris B7]
MTKMTETQARKLYEIAEKNMPAVAERGDLETRHSDNADFLDLSVWGTQWALEGAFNFGRGIEKKLTKAQQRSIYEIAAKNLPGVDGRGDLEERKCDDEDFFWGSVWGIQQALEDAFNLGRAAAK